VDCLSVTLRDGDAAPFVARGYGLGVHPLPGLAVTLAFGFGGGSLLAWARALTGAADVGALLSELPEEPGPAFAVPFWAGSGTPDLDAEDRGAIFGLTLESTRGDVVAALCRGMALEGRRNLHVLQGLGVEVREFRLVGGGARSAAWSQLRADATGRAYVEMPQHDAGCLGAAMLAAVGAGLYPGCSEAGDAMVRCGPRFEPRPEAAAVYDRLFPAYLRAVDATRAARP
jgi:xylulokinase